MECNQLKLGIISDYKDSRLYVSLTLKKNRFVKDDKMILVFYNTSDQSAHVSKNELMHIVFPDFNSAYQFILDNKVINFNIRQGSYKKEIKQYQKELQK